jgi:hypothetical protein
MATADDDDVEFLRVQHGAGAPPGGAGRNVPQF